MAGINVLKKYHGGVSTYTWAGTDVAAAAVDFISCSGYTKLLVHCYVDESWDRAGDIIVLGAFTNIDTPIVSSAATWSSNAVLWSDSEVRWDGQESSISFGIVATHDTDFTGRGQYYIINNIPPYIKMTWNNTTVGTTGNLNLTVMPFNE